MNALPGYINKSSQTVGVLNITIPEETNLDYAKVDKFLDEGFSIEELPYEKGDASGGAVENYVMRLSFLANSLLQAINIPSFAQARIIEDIPSEKSGQRKIKLLIPSIAYIPNEFALHSYAISNKILTHIHPNYELEDIFEELNEKFVEKLKKLVPSSSSSISLLYEAYRRHIPFIHLGSGLYQVGWGSKACRFDRSSSHHDTAFGMRVAIDKRVSNRLLLEAGFPMPPQMYVPDEGALPKAATTLGYPVVLKPADLERGEGVVVDIYNETDLRQAYEETKELSQNIILEKQISGICNRIFVAGGKVRYTVVRHPMNVIGDGVSTLKELADTGNNKNNKMAVHRRRKPLEFDEDSQRLLTNLGYDPDSIPEKDVRIPFRRIESTALGGIAEDVSATIHPENIKLAEEISSFLGLDIVGVDLMSEDITVPWYENGGMINEINFAPSLSLQREWSRKAISLYYDDIFPENGRIPITLFIGGVDAFEHARKYQSEASERGGKVFLCTKDATFRLLMEKSQDGIGSNLFRRTHALLLDRRADEIIVVVQDDDLLSTGFPFDSVSRVFHVDNDLKSAEDGKPLSNDRALLVRETLESLSVYDGSTA